MCLLCDQRRACHPPSVALGTWLLPGTCERPRADEKPCPRARESLGTQALARSSVTTGMQAALQVRAEAAQRRGSWGMAKDPEKLSPWCQTAVCQQLTPHTGGLAWHVFLGKTCGLLEATTCSHSWQALNAAPRTHAFHACTHTRAHAHAHVRTGTCAAPNARACDEAVDLHRPPAYVCLCVHATTSAAPNRPPQSSASCMRCARPG